MSIKVNGIGRLKVNPDLIILDVSLKTSNEDYQKSLRENQELSQYLTQSLIDYNYEKEAIKTQGFHVYHEVKEDQSILYHTNHQLNLQFPYDTKQYQKTIEIIAQSSALFNVSFGLMDETEVLEKLFVKAREDAFNKAQILAKLERKELGDIVSIDSGQFYPHFRSQAPMQRMASVSAEVELTPHMIELDVNIEYQWELK